MKTNGVLMLGVCLLTLTMCRFMDTKKGVPNEQINSDLNNKTVKFNGGKDQWYFSPDYEKCFLVEDAEVTASDALVAVRVSSWYQSDITKLYMTAIGEMLLHYKKDGDNNWVLERIEPRDATLAGISDEEEFKQFLDKHTPVCKGFRHTSY